MHLHLNLIFLRIALEITSEIPPGILQRFFKDYFIFMKILRPSGIYKVIFSLISIGLPPRFPSMTHLRTEPVFISEILPGNSRISTRKVYLRILLGSASEIASGIPDIPPLPLFREKFLEKCLEE